MENKERTVPVSVFQFGKLALWNNLVMGLWSYKNYFRIKYRPYQPSPQNQQNQPSLGQHRLCFSDKNKQIVQKLNLPKNQGVISFLIGLVPNLLSATHTVRQHCPCTALNTGKEGWTQGEAVPGNEVCHYFCNSLQGYQDMAGLSIIFIPAFRQPCAFPPFTCGE